MNSAEPVPRWASPPGDTICDALNEKQLDRAELAAQLELSEDEFETLLDGQIPLTIRLADRLSNAIGGTVEFWMTRDSQFREDKIRVAADAWAQQMPLAEMMLLGWVDSGKTDWVQRIDVCLEFFGVHNADDWKLNREQLSSKTLFRTSPSLTNDEYAVAAWLRKCDLELSKIPCEKWDKDAFQALLPQLLPLTRLPDPQEFLPELERQCAAVGVAVGVIRAPQGCPVSGAAMRLSTGQPAVALTGRHLSEDHLWFTFFHEAGHLVLHGEDALYLDEIEPDSESPKSPLENEADRFAGTILVPSRFENRLAQASRQPLELRRIADEIGVSQGIIVGNLQHRQLLGYKTKFNRLKRRYKWNGPSLERA